MNSREHFSQILKAKGLKATPGRILLLEALAKRAEPLSVGTLHSVVKKAVDQVTVYRTLESLVNAGLVAIVDLRHGHAHYELIEGRNHHHHMICVSCGEIEDIENCDISSFSKKALSQSKKFASINDHSLEFFGLCKKCLKK